MSEPPDDEERFETPERRAYTSDPNLVAINALGEQTAGGFAEIRGRLDGLAAGMDTTHAMIARLLEQGGDPPAS